MRAFSGVRVLQTFSRPICTSKFYHYIVIRRGISSSSSVRDEDTSGEDSAFKRNTRAKVDPQTVEDWFQGEGLPYLNPTPSKPNWLGGDIPFPDNPTFRPPPPLSDVVKSSIYDRYKSSVLSDPRRYSQCYTMLKLITPSEFHVRTIRALSERFGILIGRVEAIIRLKQYEHQYQKVGALSPFVSVWGYSMMNINRLVFKTPTWLSIFHAWLV
ncbi:hypothetical protein FRC12_010873 [Ceratobasidium sp. 428]|nr:hypothetical protein FRC12_010873 [Ceratobasidium sp. 428]